MRSSIANHGQSIRCLIVLGLASLVVACAGAGKGAVQGAGAGAVAGAASGLVSALIWGGDPGEHMVRGATAGATIGAVGGAVEGSQRARAQKEHAARQEQRELDALRREIGNDAFNAIVALAECKQEVAVANARVAEQSENSNHALAGLWIQALAFADQGDDDSLSAVRPEIIRWDRGVNDPAAFDRELKFGYQELIDIRAEYALPLSCS